MESVNPKQVAVVIPHYRESLNPDERASLLQCAKVLGRYVIHLVLPESLRGDEIIRLFTEKGIAPKRTSFASEYFASIEGYNRLMLSRHFYEVFAEYEYILIYQTDAWVFRDELSEWCDRGFDYIGAPWFRSYWLWRSSKRLWTSGNGGFSLRKVAAFLRVLNYTEQFKPTKSFFQISNSPLLKLKKLPFKQLFRLKFRNNIAFFISINRKTEDRFWGIDTLESYIDFRVAPNEEAMKFSFECSPRRLYELNHRQLPFGCHAWKRYDEAFWNEVYFDHRPTSSEQNDPLGE